VPKRAHAVAHIAGEVIEPRQQLDVAARFAQIKAVAELSVGRRGRLVAPHPGGDELVNAGINVKCRLLVERSIDLRGPKDIRCAREP
jgi:hypothetical protein